MKGLDFRELQTKVLSGRTQCCWGCDNYFLPSELRFILIAIVEIPGKTQVQVCNRCSSIYNEGEWYMT